MEAHIGYSHCIPTLGNPWLSGPIDHRFDEDLEREMNGEVGDKAEPEQQEKSGKKKKRIKKKETKMKKLKDSEGSGPPGAVKRR